MKAAEVHNLEDPQLVEFADNARQEVFNLRFQHATGQLENTARLQPGEAGPRARADSGAPRGIDVETEIRRQKYND